MKWVRIFSTMIDDGNHEADDQCQLVIQAKINDNDMMEPNSEYFGYQRDWNDESESYWKYPFMLEAETQRHDFVNINYGGWDNESRNCLNIISKKINPNETFTFFENSDNHKIEYIYRIKNVTPI